MKYILKLIIFLLLSVILLMMFLPRNTKSMYISETFKKKDEQTLEEFLNDYEYDISYDETIIYIIIDENSHYEVRKYILDTPNEGTSIQLPQGSRFIISLHENRTIAGKWSFISDNYENEIDVSNIFFTKESKPLESNIVVGECNRRKNLLIDNYLYEKIKIRLIYTLESASEPVRDHSISIIMK